MTDIAAMRLNAIESIREHWGWFLALGIVFIVGGIFAIAMPIIAGLTVTIIFSIILVWLGIMQIIHAFTVKSWGGFIWDLVIGLVMLAGGIASWVNPILAAITLTIVVAAVFIAKGVFEIILAFRARPHSGWWWMLIGGILSVLVGAIIWAGWPVSTAWALGYLAGISLIFTGWSYVMISLAAKRV